MKVIIIICTYNEKENTEKMLPVLDHLISDIKNHTVQVLYVDDSSPDGTAQVIEAAKPKYPWLNLLSGGKKQGLGMAYAKGMTYAMKQLQADYIMEFDADFQHPPEDIPRLIAEIDNGYDYIVGSRYIPGGSVPKEWSLDRKMISFFGNLTARILLLMPKIHDITGGFKLSRVKGFMDKFDFDKLLSRQFAYKIHLFAYMVNAGAKVKEVPFNFASRTAGDSKILKNEMKETLRVIFVYQLHNPKNHKLLKFGIVGGTGFVVNLVGLTVFSSQLSGLPYPVGVISFIANALAAELSIISNFTLNNVWTFSEEQITNFKGKISKFITFNLSSIISGIIIPSTLIGIGTQTFGVQYRTLIFVVVIFGITVPLNWYIYNHFIWKSKIKEN